MSTCHTCDPTRYVKRRDGLFYYDWMAILKQDRIWVDEDGREKQVKFLSDCYLSNIAAFMRKRAKGILFSYGLHYPTGFADDGILHAIECELAEAEADPEAWIMSFPLMRAIQERLDERAERRFRQSDQVQWVMQMIEEE